MQKIKDALAKFEYEAYQDASSIVLSVTLPHSIVNLTLTVGDDKRLHFLVGAESSAVGKL